MSLESAGLLRLSDKSFQAVGPDAAIERSRTMAWQLRRRNSQLITGDDIDIDILIVSVLPYIQLTQVMMMMMMMNEFALTWRESEDCKDT